MCEPPKILTALLVGACASTVSFAEDFDLQQNTRQEERVESGRLVRLPRAVESPPETAGTDVVIGSGFQLVGFTTPTFDGTRGILNLTLACQNEFPASRICNADDIRQTVNVPPAPGSGLAWIDVPRDLIRTRLDETANCRSWRSSASTDSGMAMDLEAAYGALVRTTCDQALRVACCAGN